MNWNTGNFVSVVHRKGRRYVLSQFTFAFPIIFSLDSNFPWLLRGVRVDLEREVFICRDFLSLYRSTVGTPRLHEVTISIRS